MSARQEIIEEFRDRLARITVANGFQTDAGLHVLVGEMPSFGPDDPTQALAISLDDDALEYQGEGVVVTLPVRVYAVIKADTAAPYVAAEAAIADIKTAVETDRNLGGLALPRGLTRGSVSAASREPGSEYVAARVEYGVMYCEGWGAP